MCLFYFSTPFFLGKIDI